MEKFKGAANRVANRWLGRKAAGTAVAVKTLPDVLKRVLKDVGYGRTDIVVTPTTSYTTSVGGGAGQKGFTAAVDLRNGTYKIEWGSWGGANIYNPNNQVDLDNKVREIPEDCAVVKGSQGSGPTYASISVHPGSVAKLLPETTGVTLTPQEESALRALGYVSSYRQDAFQRAGLGLYGPLNPYVKSLVEKGLAKVTGKAVQLTLEGKNYRMQNRLNMATVISPAITEALPTTTFMLVDENASSPDQAREHWILGRPMRILDHDSSLNGKVITRPSMEEHLPNVKSVTILTKDRDQTIILTRDSGDHLLNRKEASLIVSPGEYLFLQAGSDVKRWLKVEKVQANGGAAGTDVTWYSEKKKPEKPKKGTTGAGSMLEDWKKVSEAELPPEVKARFGGS